MAVETITVQQNQAIQEEAQYAYEVNQQRQTAYSETMRADICNEAVR